MTAPAPISRATCRPKPWPRRALVVCLPATVWGSSACDRDGSGRTVPAYASPSTTATTTQAATRSFVKPFVGVIRVRETIAGTHVGDVEYTIDAQRIRREKAYVVPQKVLGAPRRVGVIVDLTKGRAIRYETVNNKRYFLEQRIEQYDASLDDATNFAYGTTFYENGVRQSGRYRAVTAAYGAVVDGVACDVLRLDPPQFNALVHHAPGISVDRSLLARVEPGIPVEVTGFPLRVHVGLVQWGGMPEPPKTSRIEQLGDRAVRAATRATSRASAVLDTKLDVVTILEGPVDAAAFNVPDGFTAAGSFEEFTEKIRPKREGGGSSFDFD